tara:strand:- start:119 stop:403 length:285 start_codon:yes stop_codon:yes gene_type:complete
MSMAARASKRAQQAMHGHSTQGASGNTKLPNGKGGFITVTNGSVINYGGVDKFGLYPTVGVSVGFLNMLEACCASAGPYPRVGVNTSQGNNFLM